MKDSIILDIVSKLKRLFIIDGKTYKGKCVKVTDSKVGNIIIDGDCHTQTLGLNFEVIVQGDVESVSTSSGDVKCRKVESVNTMSGDVECSDVSGDITTMSGDVECGDVRGDVETMSGNIRRR